MVWTETEELLLYCFIPTNSVSSGRRNSIAIQSLGFLVTLCLWFLFSPAPECVETRQRAVLQRISFYEEEDINYSLLKLQRLIVLPHSWYLIKIYVGNHFLIYNCYSILSIINIWIEKIIYVDRSINNNLSSQQILSLRLTLRKQIKLYFT
jgi:hypothetical protein